MQPLSTAAFLSVLPQTPTEVSIDFSPTTVSTVPSTMYNKISTVVFLYLAATISPYYFLDLLIYSLILYV